MDVRELFDAYLDDELTADERATVDSALAASTELETELADLAAVRSALRELPEVEPPAGFFDAMLERGSADPAAALPDGVASLSTARSTKATREKRSLTSRVTSIVAAAAVFMLVLGFGSGISAIERVPALDDFANRHAEALAAMDSGTGAETDRFHAMPMEEVKGMGPDSMDMMGAYQSDESGSDDKVMQFLYSDGSGNIISVFRQNGYVKANDMPEAETLQMAGDDAWHLQQGEYDTLVIDRDGVTFTVVGALDSGEMMESLANDLPDIEMGMFDKVQDLSRGVLDSVGIN